jgi:hypothetical protein
MISLSVFENSEAAEASNRIAARWIERWIADHPNAAATASRVDAGPVLSSATACATGWLQDGGTIGPGQ